MLDLVEALESLLLAQANLEIDEEDVAIHCVVVDGHLE